MPTLRNLIKKSGRALTPGRAGQPMIPPGSTPPAPPGQRLSQTSNAGLIYCAGGAFIYILAFYHLATASWFNGIVLLIPATSLAFLGYRYMQQ